MSIFENRNAFISDIKETNSSSESDRIAEEIFIDNMSDTNESEHSNFSSDAFETDLTRKFLFLNDGSGDTGEVINDGESKKHLNEAVKAAKEPCEQTDTPP